MTFNGSDILPSNATPLERALADMDWSRVSGLDPEIVKSVVNPSTCPVDLLPWLAWSLRVMTWDPNWPEATKRSVIAASPGIHKIKGTRQAVELALNALGLTYTISEWWETTPQGRRGTFNVALDVSTGTPAVTLNMLNQTSEAISNAKPKSRVGSLSLEATIAGSSYAAGSLQNSMTVTINPGP